jgi:hypothetical protein
LIIFLFLELAALANQITRVGALLAHLFAVTEKYVIALREAFAAIITYSTGES